MFEWGGQSEGSLHRDVTQQVRFLAALLQLVRCIVQHLLVAVAHLLHFQPVDLPTQVDQLAGQTVVLNLHLPLRVERLEGWGRGVGENVSITEKPENVWKCAFGL